MIRQRGSTWNRVGVRNYFNPATRIFPLEWRWPESTQRLICWSEEVIAEPSETKLVSCNRAAKALFARQHEVALGLRCHGCFADSQHVADSSEVLGQVHITDFVWLDAQVRFVHAE